MNTVLVGLASTSYTSGMGDVRQDTVTALLALGLVVLAAGLWKLWRMPLTVGVSSSQPRP